MGPSQISEWLLSRLAREGGLQSALEGERPAHARHVAVGGTAFFACVVPLDFLAFDSRWSGYYAVWHGLLSLVCLWSLLALRLFEKRRRWPALAFYLKRIVFITASLVNAVYSYFLLTVAPENYALVMPGVATLAVMMGFLLHRNLIETLLFHALTIAGLLASAWLMPAARNSAMILVYCHFGSLCLMAIQSIEFKKRLRLHLKNIDENRELKELVERMQRESFVADHVSVFLHEIKTTLFLLELANEATKAGEASEKKISSVLGAVRSGLSHTRGLVESFLVEISGEEKEKIPLDASLEVSDVLRLVNELMRKKDIILEVSGQEMLGGLLIEAGPRDLAIVGLNLVKNASQAVLDKTNRTKEPDRPQTSEGDYRAKISIAFEMNEDDYFSMSVSDNGEGMTPEKASSYLQGERSLGSGLSRDGGGYGIGAYAIHSACRRSGFELAVDSVLGVGTTVRVRVPIKRKADGEAAAHAKSA